MLAGSTRRWISPGRLTGQRGLAVTCDHEGVARALGPHKVCLMKNHGVAIAGASIEESVIIGIMLENACRIQMLIEAAGSAAPEFPADDVQLLKDKIKRPEQMAVNFDYLRRKVKRQR